MKRFFFFFLATCSLLLAPCPYLWAQVPTVNPTGTYFRIDDLGKEETGDVNTQTLSLPFRVVFNANLVEPLPTGYGSDAHFTWTITNTKSNKEDTQPAPIVRADYNLKEFEYEFTESGTYLVKLCVIFYDEDGLNEENILYKISDDEDRDEDPKTISFSASESKLEFPNGISPNDDEKNDVLKAKEGYKSIVSFHAAVFNRWGQKLYAWDDVRGGWDGKYKGKPVKDGVYFLVVSAKGGDGIDYNIKKAINVISGYNDGENANNGGNE